MESHGSPCLKLVPTFRCHINGSTMQDAKGSRVTNVVMDGKGESNHGSFYEFRGRNQSVSGQLIFGHRTLQ